jgi:hypothetical protein
MSDYRVTTVSPEEGEAVLARLRGATTENKNARRSVVLPGGFELKGSFELVCREEKTGEVAWAHSDNNLITDYGRRIWMDYKFSGMTLGFCASTETPTAARSSLSGDSTQIFFSATLTPSNNSVTNTKTLSTTFTTPPNNRTLGSILLMDYYASAPNGIARGICAYALLTPPKTQTTTQTLEVVYKISMSPIY